MAKLTLKEKVDLYENFLNDIAKRDLVAIAEESFSEPEDDGSKNYPYAYGYTASQLEIVIMNARYALAQGAKK